MITCRIFFCFIGLVILDVLDLLDNLDNSNVSSTKYKCLKIW